MLTHDQLIFCIQQMHSDLIHGRDFWVAHPVAHGGTEQLGDAEIIQWSADVAQPNKDTLKGIWRKVRTTYQKKQTRQAVLAERDRRLEAATRATCGLQDAYLAGLLSTAETLSFKAWAAYQKALMFIEQQASFPKKINWPISPAEKESV